MQRKNYIIFINATFAFTLWGTLIFFICEIGIGSSYVKSANADIHQQRRSERNEGNSVGYQHVRQSDKTPSASEIKMLKIFGSQAPSLNHAEFKKMKSYIDAFFLYLDDQPYVKSYRSFKSSGQQFKDIIEILALNLPTVTRETDSFEDVCKNLFYFYRVLGKERILFLKDVLSNESDIIEPMMICFYQWLIHSAADSNRNTLRLSLKQLCGYAGFFLETFGGRNYLFRRSTKVRTLISYYCILTINKADQEGYNPYGLDIRPNMGLVIESLVQQTGFDYKDHYLNELVELRKKYPIYSSK